MSETDPHTSEIDEKAQRNWPDIGGPSWHESMQQRGQEFRKRLDYTLKSAIEREVIPNIWDVSEDERSLFFKGLHRALHEHLRYIGLRDEAQPEPDKEYTDKELQDAWCFARKTLDEIHRGASQKQYDEAIRQGLLPAPGSVEPALYQRYNLAAIELSPAPVLEYVKLWARIQAEWNADNERNTAIDDNLTRREKEIAHLLAQGMNDGEIANKLIIALGTVRKHRKNIKNKWNMPTQDIQKMREEARRRGYGGG